MGSRKSVDCVRIDELEVLRLPVKDNGNEMKNTGKKEVGGRTDVGDKDQKVRTVIVLGERELLLRDGRSDGRKRSGTNCSYATGWEV